VWRTAIDDLRGIRRLGWSLVTRRLPLEEVRARLGVARDGGRLGAQLALFAIVGVASTLAYALVYLLLRQVAPSQLANLSALLLTAIGNTAANRRFTFGVRGEGSLRHHGQGLLVLAVGLALTSGSLALLDLLAPRASHAVEVGVLTAANLAVTVLRFAAMRLWIFRLDRSTTRLEVRNPETAGDAQ
jgi:putative flippase GtrA